MTSSEVDDKTEPHGSRLVAVQEELLIDEERDVLVVEPERVDGPTARDPVLIFLDVLVVRATRGRRRRDALEHRRIAVDALVEQVEHFDRERCVSTEEFSYPLADPDV